MQAFAFARRVALSWARSRELTPQRVWPVLRERGGLEPFLSADEEELAGLLKSHGRARAVLAAPRVPAGPGWLRIDANGVEISTGGRTAYIATRVPLRGRITLRIAAQHAFSELSIEAVLDPSWGAARALFLRERR